MRLPWKLVLSETYGVDFFNALEGDATLDDPQTRKRGFIHVIDSDPSKIDLPQRCLPIYLLNRRHYERQTNFEGQLRRMTMLEILRQSGVRQVVIVSFHAEPIPADLKDLWVSDFKSNLTFLSDNGQAESLVDSWTKGIDVIVPVNFISGVRNTIRDIISRYLRGAFQLTHNLIGASLPMREVSARIAKVARTDATVMIRGETGTGKELAAADVRNHRRHQ